LYAVEQIDVNGVATVSPQDIRGTYEQAHDVMARRLVFGEQRIVAMTVGGDWIPVVQQ
jgi:hypothetical protein